MSNLESSELPQAAPPSQDSGPFVTYRLRPLRDGGHLVANSRRHRKGLRPHRVADVALAMSPYPSHTQAFRHFWAPSRLAWWVAVVFILGAALFTLGGCAAAWPDSVPEPLRDASTLGRLFVVGAIFFTSAAWLQWLEAVNGDVAEAFDRGAKPRWRWLGWCPRNLGYLASAVQLVGTVMFNFNTVDATLSGLSWRQTDLLIWTPNMVGCLCFLVASCLAYAEVSHGALSFAPRSLSWWVAVVNLLGSIAFQISAFYSIVGPTASSADAAFWANFYTAVGGFCFLVGAYLMIPELFDEDPASETGPPPSSVCSDRKIEQLHRPLGRDGATARLLPRRYSAFLSGATGIQSRVEYGTLLSCATQEA